MWLRIVKYCCFLLVLSMVNILACDGERVPVDEDSAGATDIVGNEDTTQPPADVPADLRAEDLSVTDFGGPHEISFVDVGVADLPDLTDATVVDVAIVDIEAEELPVDITPVDLPLSADTIKPDVPSLPEGCCYSDEDCDTGTDAAFVCGWNDMSGEWGRCMWLVPEGNCWDDSDCADDEVCNGAFYCPCDALCGAPDVPGTCMAPDEEGDVGDPCGQNGGDCKEGLECCYPCGIPGCIFQCTEPCDPTEPWCEGGCPLYA